MNPRITNVRHVKDYILELTFSDGKQAELDFKKKIVGRGGVFVPLHNIDFFRQARVDPEFGTIVWPNDVDLDPDVLYSEVTGIPLRTFNPAETA